MNNMELQLANHTWVQRISKNANNFQVVTENAASTLTDGAFDFHVIMG